MSTASSRRRFALAAALGAIACLAPLVLASSEANAVNRTVQRACKADYQQLCPSYKVGTPALRACMESNANLISPGCIQALIDSGEVNRNRRR